MNKYILLFSFLFALSCKELAGRGEKNDIEMVRVSKVMVDESELVYSRMPQSLRAVNDSMVACIADYQTIAVYSTKTGKVLYAYATDSLLSRSGFDIVAYIKTYCLPDYPDRDYMLDKKEIAKRPVQPSQTFFIAAPIRTLDSVALLMSVLTPYSVPYVYEGKQTTANMLASSFLIANVNLDKGTVNSIKPLHEGLFDVNVHKLIPNPEYGSLVRGDKVFICLYPDPNKPEQGNGVGMFDIGVSPSYKTVQEVYPDEQVRHPKQWIPKKHFVTEANGGILFNGLFGIYRIKADLTTEQVVDLKQQLNVEGYEYIHCFARLADGNFMIQTAVADSGTHYFDFRLYNPETQQLSGSKLRMAAHGISPNVIFKDNHVIFFSKYEEHLYIETYEMVGP